MIVGAPQRNPWGKRDLRIAECTQLFGKLYTQLLQIRYESCSPPAVLRLVNEHCNGIGGVARKTCRVSETCCCERVLCRRNVQTPPNLAQRQEVRSPSLTVDLSDRSSPICIEHAHFSGRREPKTKGTQKGPIYARTEDGRSKRNWIY